MAALTSAQETRAIEFQSDICNLVHADFANPNFTQWWDAYQAYVTYGTEDSRGGQRPGHRPPV